MRYVPYLVHRFLAAMSRLQFETVPNPNPKSPEARRAALENLGFGRVFSDHMAEVRYAEGVGWHGARIVPYGPICLEPAASVFHYGQAIFEGFKAFRQSDGGLATFRPDANGRRFQSSARRLAMPELPTDDFVNAADLLLKQDRAWVPENDGESVYLRPLLIATEAVLGVRPSKEYLFLLMASPSGAYFPKGVRPVTVWITRDYVRAAVGGTGDAKCAGNYAASLVAQKQANDAGCEQVVWLDAVKRTDIEEMGGMNLFFVYGEGKTARLVTPKLTGSLLPGVTRDSLLLLARDLGIGAEESTITVDEWRAGVRSGAITEVFACGTAAVITPVGEVRSEEGSFVIHGGETGPVARQLRSSLLEIQYGRVPDTRGWMHRVY
jgi:branched-chain amino acid aminotransferase